MGSYLVSKPSEVRMGFEEGVYILGSHREGNDDSQRRTQQRVDLEWRTGDPALLPHRGTSQCVPLPENDHPCELRFDLGIHLYIANDRDHERCPHTGAHLLDSAELGCVGQIAVVVGYQERLAEAGFVSYFRPEEPGWAELACFAAVGRPVAVGRVVAAAADLVVAVVAVAHTVVAVAMAVGRTGSLAAVVVGSLLSGRFVACSIVASRWQRTPLLNQRHVVQRMQS